MWTLLYLSAFNRGSICHTHYLEFVSLTFFLVSRIFHVCFLMCRGLVVLLHGLNEHRSERYSRSIVMGLMQYYFTLISRFSSSLSVLNVCICFQTVEDMMPSPRNWMQMVSKFMEWTGLVSWNYWNNLI